jgi:predicted Zn finger-like uncharacterized protein
MIVVCPGCKNQITLDDATLPAGAFKVRCTGCGRSITTQRKEQPVASPPAASPPSATSKQTPSLTEKPAADFHSEGSTAAPSMDALIQTQVAAAKKEILEAMQVMLRGGTVSTDLQTYEHGVAKRALICSGDAKTGEVILELARRMGYDTQSCSTAAESLKNADSFYTLIVIDPSFTDDLDGSKKLIGRINTKKGIERRRTFVVLLSSTQKSLDGNSAFLSGVNLIVNKADLNNLESLVAQSQQDFQQMYSAFRSVEQKI